MSILMAIISTALMRANLQASGDDRRLRRD
jgi:hypothetical protein